LPPHKGQSDAVSLKKEEKKEREESQERKGIAERPTAKRQGSRGKNTQRKKRRILRDRAKKKEEHEWTKKEKCPKKKG
jgi:hypothetical protein